MSMVGRMHQWLCVLDFSTHKLTLFHWFSFVRFGFFFFEKSFKQNGNVYRVMVQFFFSYCTQWNDTRTEAKKVEHYLTLDQHSHIHEHIVQFSYRIFQFDNIGVPGFNISKCLFGLMCIHDNLYWCSASGNAEKQRQTHMCRDGEWVGEKNEEQINFPLENWFCCDHQIAWIKSSV